MTSAPKTALFLSPHLDDAVFSAGATMAALADRGWRVVMATVFTRSVPDPTGFALACQLDKGLAPDVDYMALRRAEDADAAALLGAEPRWLDLPEAPHRGYTSAPDLFAGMHPDDGAWQDVAAALAALDNELHPDTVLTCQGLGNHVDHLQVIRAVLAVLPVGRLGFWRDTPYVIRQPGAQPDAALPALPDRTVPISALGQAARDRKVAAACAYRSQVGFQFGGPDPCADALRALMAHDNGEVFRGSLPKDIMHGVPAWA